MIVVSSFMENTYFVYILECSDGSLYTGITNNLENRLKTHQEGKGSKYVRARLPFKLVHSESCNGRSEASKKESEIKSMTRAQKETYIKGD